MAKASQRSKAQEVMADLARQGVSANAALQQLKEQGLAYRRKDFLEDYRQYTGREKPKDVAKHIRKDYRPAPETLVPDVRNLKDKYQSLVEYTWIDKETGEIKVNYIYIGSDKIPYVGDIEKQAKEILSLHERDYHSKVKGITYKSTRYRVD